MKWSCEWELDHSCILMRGYLILFCAGFRPDSIVACWSSTYPHLPLAHPGHSGLWLAGSRHHSIMDCRSCELNWIISRDSGLGPEAGYHGRISDEKSDCHQQDSSTKRKWMTWNSIVSYMNSLLVCYLFKLKLATAHACFICSLYDPFYFGIVSSRISFTVQMYCLLIYPKQNK